MTQQRQIAHRPPRAALDVLVVGMHRSGTSALAGALRAAGLSPGEVPEGWLISAENPLGFAERRDVVELNDRLLQSLDWTWSSPPAAPLIVPPERPELVEACRALVASNLAPARPWLIKDPRLSLLLPWWRQVLLDRFVAVVSVRPPQEVAWSLSVRNGFPVDLGLALWAAYHRHLAQGLQGLPVVVVDYVSLTAEPRATSELVLDALKRLGVARQLDAQAAAESIDPLLRRATAPPHGGSTASHDSIAALAAAWSMAPVRLIERFSMENQEPASWEESILQVERRARHEEVRAAAAAAVAEAARQRAVTAVSDTHAARSDADLARRTAEQLQVQATIAEGQLKEHRRREFAAARRGGALASKLAEVRRQRDAAKEALARHETAADELRGRLKSVEEARERSERLARDSRAELTVLLMAKLAAEGRAVATVQRSERLHAELLDERRTRSEYEREIQALRPEPARAAALEDHVARLQGEVAHARAEVDQLLLATYRAGHATRRRRWRWPRAAWWRPIFDARWYVSQYPDVAASRLTAAWHFRRHGRSEGRDPNAYFDGRWYISRYPDVAAQRLDALYHYVQFGALEGRDPSEGFSTLAYLRRNPEVVAAGLNPLEHLLSTAARDHSTRGLLGTAARGWTYLRRHGLAASIRKAVTKSAAWWADRRLPLRPTTLPPEVRPDDLHGSLDLPVEGWSESSTALNVAGWACAESGIASLGIFVDGVPAGRAEIGLPRHDVAQVLPEIAEAPRAGYSTTVRVDHLADGEHELALAIADRAGNVRVVTRRFRRLTAAHLYHGYFERTLPRAEEIRRFRRIAATDQRLPKLMLWIDATGDVTLEAASATLSSVAQQEFPAWRCTLLVSPDRCAAIERLIGELDAHRDRFTVVTEADRLPPLVGGFLAILRAGEVLARHALFPLAVAAREKDVSIVYSDHDRIEPSGRHVDPQIAPDYSPDHLLSRDYVGGFFLARVTPGLHALAVEALAGGRLAWRFELLLRLLDDERLRLVHVPRLLWSEPAQSALFEMESAEKTAIVDETLRRRGLAAEVHECAPAIRRVRWQLERRPKVSIIMPTTGRMDHLKACVESILERTNYDNYELLAIDNGRGAHPEGIDYLRSLDVRVLERNEPFNWAKLNNDGARSTDGELLLFLNDDVEVHDGDWLTEMVAQAVRPGVGSVGALLLFPDGMVQHAGIFLVGHGGGAMHFFHHQDPNGEIYLNLHRATREVAASTGACLMVRRDVFEKFGGFDTDLAVVGNDVDLCLRLLEGGYRNVWTPHAVLVHHESVSRGALSIDSDESKMWSRWSRLLRRGDPYFSPHFAQDRPDCVIAWDAGSRGAAQVDSAPAAGDQGVNLIGYIRAEMGIGQATRADAQALSAEGMPFVILDHSDGNPARMDDQSWLHKVVTRPAFDVNLVRINADWIVEAANRLGSDVFDGRYNIGCWAWELGEFPDRWRSAFDMVDEIWAPSRFVQQAIAAKSPVPVVHIPHAVSAPAGPFRDRAYFGLPAGRFQFLTMYDVHSVRERKNPEAAIRAFMAAFAAHDDGVSLVIKLNNGDGREERALRELIGNRSNILVIDRVLDREAVDSLLAVSDCYVSLHRSEGFGLPIAEAMGLAKPVIATNWSGNVDFTREDNAGCVGYRLVRIAKSVGPYDAGQWWAEPDLGQAADWMRRLRADPVLARTLGERAREMVERELSPSRVGRLMAERIAAIRAARLVGSQSRVAAVDGRPDPSRTDRAVGRRRARRQTANAG